jgi:hypothetical protein
VDDSGSGEGKTRGNIFTLCGFLATADRWESFSRKWEEICDQEPRTPNFKMRKAYRLKEYGWTEQQRDTRIAQLVALIRERSQYRIESIVAWPNYDRVVRGKVPADIDSPYFLLFYNVIFAFSEFMAAAGIEGTVDWIFDCQGSIGLEALKWYEFIRANAAPHIQKRLGATPVFLDDDSFLPLKAADLHAWQMRRHLDREQPSNLAPNAHLDDLLGIHGTTSIIQGEHLEEFVGNIHHGLLLKSDMKHFLPLKAGDLSSRPG